MKNGHQRGSWLGWAFHKTCMNAQSEFYGNLAKLGKKWFVHLHNFNSNSEYYINPVDGIKTNLVSSCQTLTFKERAIAVETQVVNSKWKWVFFWFLKIAKTWSKSLNGLWTERKFVTFNGLPIDKPLITVDVSVQINNNNNNNNNNNDNNKLYLSVRYFAMELIESFVDYCRDL